MRYRVWVQDWGYTDYFDSLEAAQAWLRRRRKSSRFRKGFSIEDESGKVVEGMRGVRL